MKISPSLLAGVAALLQAGAAVATNPLVYPSHDIKADWVTFR